MKKMKSKSLFAIYCLALTFFLLATVGCQTQQKSAGKTLEAKDFILRYSDKSADGPEVSDLEFQHPLNISERQLIQQMWALKYQGNALVSEPTHVFTKNDISKVRRLLTKALNKAHPQNLIGFVIDAEDGTTRGLVFASDGKLYWKFEEIQGVRFNLTKNFQARYGTAWRLLPQKSKGQKLFVSDKLFGSKVWENWIVAKLAPQSPKPQTGMKQKPKSTQDTSLKQQPVNGPSQVQSETQVKTPQQPSMNPELEKKLQFLKSLRERNLIGESEYLQKRKELLDSYF
jgi:hypothetical protein